MGFFDSLFSSAASTYSRVEQPFPEHDIRRLISDIGSSTVTDAEEHVIENAILARRRGDGRISLRQIYEAVHALRRAHKISNNDEKFIMKKCEEYFKRFA